MTPTESRRRRPSNRPPPANAQTFGQSLWPWLIVGATAFAVRLGYLLQFRDTDLAVALLGDAAEYDAWATRIAAGAWVGDAVFYQAPLYPYFLGVIYAVASHDLWVVRLVQVAVGTLSCLCIGKAADILFSRRVGILAGIGMALCPALVFVDGLIQKTVLDVFFFTLVCCASAVAIRTPGKARTWLALGAAAGLLALTRENALMLMPLLLILAWQQGRWRPVLLVLAGTAVILLPVMVRNGLIGGSFYLTTAQMGPNFYIGNNPDATGTYQPLLPYRGDARFERSDATILAERQLARPLSPAEVSQFWLVKSVEFIRTEPGRWLQLTGRKVFLVWNAAELADTDEPQAYAEYSSILRWLSAFLHFGVLCPLAAVGVVWSWPRRRRVWILMAMALVYAASVAAFYVLARYRLPLFPLVIVFAAFALSEFPSRMRWPLARSSWLGLAVAAIAAVFVNWPVSMPTTDGSITWNNVGVWLNQRGQHERAIEYFNRVLAGNPESEEGLAGKGLALGELGRLDEALVPLRAVVSRDPEFPNAAMHLGNTLFAQGRTAEALPYLQSAVTLDPDSADAHYNLANALVQANRPADAVGHFEKAIEINPAFANAHYNFAGLLLNRGRLEEAVHHLEQAAEARPELVQARVTLVLVLRALAAARAETGRFTEAENAIMRATVLAREQGDASMVAELARDTERIRARQPLRERR